MKKKTKSRIKKYLILTVALILGSHIVLTFLMALWFSIVLKKMKPNLDIFGGDFYEIFIVIIGSIVIAAGLWLTVLSAVGLSNQLY